MNMCHLTRVADPFAVYQEHIPAEIIWIHEIRFVTPVHDLNVCPVLAAGSLEEIASEICISAFHSTPPQFWYLVGDT